MDLGLSGDFLSYYIHESGNRWALLLLLLLLVTHVWL